jgi:ubiquinone/menaquinone biosynthesis C-methylase UbiE
MDSDSVVDSEVETDFYEIMSSNDHLPNYGSRDYWDDEYAKGVDEFDWYMQWLDFRPSLTDLLIPGDIVLNVGCGNSRMALQLKKDFEKVVSIDTSSVAIERMKEMHKDDSMLQWYVMNCAELEFDDGVFDCIVDKGTMDAILCRVDANWLMGMAMNEYWRVLRLGGRFFVISYGVPEQRKRVFGCWTKKWKAYEPICQVCQQRNTKYWIYVFEKQEC